MYVYSIAMNQKFRGITNREGILFRGKKRWAEFSPFLEYSDAQVVPWLQAAVEYANADLPETKRSLIPVNVTIPAVSAEVAGGIVRNSGGCQSAKVKVCTPGQSLANEVDRLEAVRQVLGPNGKIRIDVNGGWSSSEAIRNIKVLDQAAGGLEYVEQPCRSLAELAEVRKAVQVPIAADESIRNSADPLRAIAQAAADVLIFKVQPLGGISRCLELAEQVKKPIVVSSALETTVGLTTGLHLAGLLSDLPYACGLATHQLLTADVCFQDITVNAGQIALNLAEVDVAKLSENLAAPEREKWWRQRFESVAKLAGITEVEQYLA